MKILILAVLPAVALCQLAGGISDTTVSATYEPVVFAVKAINAHLAETSGSNHELSLLDIVHARTQVVAGEKLYLTLHLTGDYYCDVNVWYRAWLTGDERLQITDGPTCTQHKASARVGGRVGGISQPQPLSQAGDEVANALQFAACALNDRINAAFALTTGDISAVTYTQQVTAGMTYRFYNVPMVSTSCQNQGCAALDLSACHANHAGQGMTCNFEVQYQAWMPQKYTLNNLNC